MLKKRIIFTLLFNDGYFALSRNFRLQKVGDIDWLMKNYQFSLVANAIDELIILDVTRYEKNTSFFCEILKKISRDIFIPIAAGGGISTMSHAKDLMKSGADKLVVNSELHHNPQFVTELVKQYGSQCIVGSIDFQKHDKITSCFVNNGSCKIDYNLHEYCDYLESLGVGELYINSIDKDGTGQDYDYSAVSGVLSNRSVPVILAGGAGNYKHLLKGIQLQGVEAVATANILNFIGGGLEFCREKLLDSNINLPVWGVRKCID